MAKNNRDAATSGETVIAVRRPVNRARNPLRSFSVMLAVGMLVTVVAMPTYSATAPAAEVATLEDVASENAQSIVVASEITPLVLERSTYLASTQKELDKLAAQAAAASRFNQQAYVAELLERSKYPLTSPDSGEVVYPLPKGSYKFWRTVTSYHQGVDWTAPAGTPIYAATSGTVIKAPGYHAGWGYYVQIAGVVGGKRVTTLYAHMINGSRRVQAGDTVEAGQLIGLVGNTGRSQGPHLHLEVKVNNVLVEPVSWFKVNAG
jgi:murein DD-endopeptidase MepM/ murein hydrolase activator NlpD